MIIADGVLCKKFRVSFEEVVRPDHDGIRGPRSHLGDSGLEGLLSRKSSPAVGSETSGFASCAAPDCYLDSGSDYFARNCASTCELVPATLPYSPVGVLGLTLHVGYGASAALGRNHGCVRCCKQQFQCVRK